MVVREAKRRGIYPVQLIESLVREKVNPFGHSDIDGEVAYLRKLRKHDSHGSDKTFIEEIRRWQMINSESIRTGAKAIIRGRIVKHQRRREPRQLRMLNASAEDCRQRLFVDRRKETVYVVLQPPRRSLAVRR